MRSFSAGSSRFDDAGLDRVIEPLQPKVGLGGALGRFGDVLTAALGASLAAVQRPSAPLTSYSNARSYGY